MDRIIVSKVMKSLVGECAFTWGGSYANMEILSGQDKPSESDFTAKYNELNKTENADLRELRAQRDLLLQQTDWWASADLTMTDAQKKYRQDLRDITKTYKSLKDVKWPTEPTS